MARKKYNPDTRKKRGANWTETRKTEALALYKENEFNTLKTSKMLGVAETTLRLWARQKNVIKQSPTIEQIESDIEIIYADLNHEGFTVNAFNVKQKALNRLEELVVKEKDIRRLVEAIKLLHDIAAPPILAEGKGKSLSEFLMGMQEELVKQQGNQVN